MHFADRGATGRGMRPAQRNMYGQAAYVVPQNGVHYYGGNHAQGSGAGPAGAQYGRNPPVQGQEMAHPSQLQPVYVVHQQAVMHQYPAVVGVPSQVVGNPVAQAMAVQGVAMPAYGQGWAYRPAMEPMWSYGADRAPQQLGPQQPQEPRGVGNWQRPPAHGYSQGNGISGFQGHGSGVGGFQGRGEGYSASAGFQGRGDGHGNVQSFGKPSGDGRRPDRGFESSSGNRHYSSGGPGRQHMNRQGAPPQSPAP